MAQNYTLMARKNLLKPSETPKFYAVARSGRKVTVKEVCKRITERSSYSKGELEVVSVSFCSKSSMYWRKEISSRWVTWVNFRMSIKTGTPTDTAKEFKASCIDKGKVLFYPGSDLRKLCKTLDYTLYKSDSSTDLDKDPLPDDGGDDNQGGSGSGKLDRQHNQPVVDWFLSS